MPKKRLILFLLLFLTLHAPSYALDVGKAASFGLGWVAGIYLHEMGHAAVALAQGGKVEELGFAYTNVGFQGSTDEVRGKFRVTDLAGYATQTLVSEIVLQHQEWHRSDFALGLLTFGIFNNVNNLVRYYFLGERGPMDLAAFERQGGDPTIPAILMALHAAFSVYRIFNKSAIVPYIGSDILGFSTRF